MKSWICVFLIFCALDGRSEIVANSDVIDYMNSPSAKASASVLANDLLNGETVTAGDAIVSGVNLPSGFKLNEDGTFLITLGTDAGPYRFAYRVQERANPENTALSIGLFNLSSSIEAKYDRLEFTNMPNSGASASVLANDLLNGATPTTDEVIVSAVNLPSGFTLNADGTILVALGTQSGTYQFTYRIRETANPENTAFVTSLFELDSNIKANTEIIDFLNRPGAGVSASVLANDLLNGTTPTADKVIVSAVNVPVGLTLNADGTFSVALGTQAGTYRFTYRIQETTHLENSTFVTSLLELSSNIEAKSEMIDFVNGPDANITASVLENDLLNGTTPTVDDVIVSVVNLPVGLTLNANGTISVAEDMPNGLYGFTYRIQEKAHPENSTFTTSLFSLTSKALTLAEVAGSYDCLVERDESLNDNNGGRLRFTVTGRGQMSGFLVHKLVRYPFTVSAVQMSVDSGECTILVPRSGVTIIGSFTHQAGTTEGGKVLITFSGTVVGQNLAEASFSGARATERSSASPSPYFSTQTTNIVFQKAISEPTTSMGGVGFMRVTITRLGIVLATLWAADGSAPVSLASSLSETSEGGTFPVYLIIPNASGPSTLLGQIVINRAGYATGDLSWFMEATQRGPFPDGIPLISMEGVMGSRFVPEPLGLNLLGYEESITVAELDLSGIEMSDDPELTLTVQRTSMRAVARAKVTALKMKFDRRTGLMTGGMTMPASATSRSRAVAFRGIRLPNGKGVVGHFTVPSTKIPKKLNAGMLKVSAR